MSSGRLELFSRMSGAEPVMPPLIDKTPVPALEKVSADAEVVKITGALIVFAALSPDATEMPGVPLLSPSRDRAARTGAMVMEDVVQEIEDFRQPAPRDRDQCRWCRWSPAEKEEIIEGTGSVREASGTSAKWIGIPKGVAAAQAAPDIRCRARPGSRAVRIPVEICRCGSRPGAKKRRAELGDDGRPHGERGERGKKTAIWAATIRNGTSERTRLARRERMRSGRGGAGSFSF